jgi:predicted HAD superfamily phosphohydrolase
MKKYWEEMDILKYTSENPILHATMAERSIRTLKERTTKWMTEHSTKRWIDNIQEITSAINHTVHTTTKMRPVDVNYENGKELYQHLYETSGIKNKAIFKIGDTVRFESYKGKFAKGKSNFTDSSLIQFLHFFQCRRMEAAQCPIGYYHLQQ